MLEYFGRIKLTLEKPGYKPWEGFVDIAFESSESSPVEVSVALEPQEGATPK